MRTLEQHLVRCEPIRLEAIARLWEGEPPSGRHGEAAAALAEWMSDPARIASLWEALPPAEREALAGLLSAGGRMPWRSFTRRWGEVRTMGPARMERERPWEQPVSPAERLWYHGLVFRDLEEGPDGLIETAVVPEELRRHLPAPPPPTPRLETVPPPPFPRLADRALLDDGCTLLAYLQNHHVRPGPEGEWPAQDEMGLLRQLRDPAQDRLAFLHHLAVRLGWVRTDAAGRLRPDPEPVTAWLQAPAFEQQAAMASAWRDDPTWNDLWHVPSLRPDETGSWRNDPLLARRAILGHLTACPPDEWVPLEGFIAAVKEADPDFQRPDGDYSTWYIRDASTGEYLSGFECWEAVEGALIRYLLTGPMAWLGLVDLGAEREGGPAVAFRLSPAGAAFLGLAEPEPEPEPPPLTVRPDLIVLVPARHRYVRFQLSRVADWVRTDDPYVYRLTASSLERARSQGISARRVREFLERESQGRLPPSVGRALERWEGRGRQVWLERGILLRVREEEMLRELMASPAIRRFIREAVGPTAALVSPADWPRLVRLLVERGFLPDLDGLDEEEG